MRTAPPNRRDGPIHQAVANAQKRGYYRLAAVVDMVGQAPVTLSEVIIVEEKR